MRIEFKNYTALQNQFEEQYISLRKKEGRLYSDEEVRLLPSVPKKHPLASEWKIRTRSAGRLAAYLGEKSTALRILEVGCGNGWLSHRLSLLKGSSVTGLDINTTELEQAKRVFSRENLDFVYGDIRRGILKERFDVVVFAASIQYFSSVREIIYAALKQLKPGGEVHIMDTYFYNSRELPAAIERSKHYFKDLGFPSMENYYFHHPLEALNVYAYNILYDPTRFPNKILKRSPFYWIRIRKC